VTPADRPRHWTEHPAVIAIAGTFAVHVVLGVLGLALIDAVPPPEVKPPPVVELVDIDVPRPPPPPPPPPEPKAAEPEPVAPTPVAVKAEPRARVRSTPPPPTNEPPPPPSNTPPSPDSGGGPVTTMEDIAPEAKGTMAIPKGPRTSGSGRGGTGTGTGSGAGAGSSDAPPAPVSVATIKTRAMPKGDFSYVDASKDYPPEAKALGIEGVIRVRLVVDATGVVKSATLLNRLGHGLDELALTRAKTIQFDPAKDTDDKPVSSVVVWTFNMTLPK
jgi:protein TonB